MAEELTSASRAESLEKGLALRRSRHPSAIGMMVLISVLVLTIPIFFKTRAELPLWVYLVAAVGAICFLFTTSTLLYQAFTPLLKIKRDVLISYGMAPWEKRQFRLADISGVTFHLPILRRYWRPAHLITLKLAGTEHRMWLPDDLPSPVLPARKMLQTNFGDRYTEVTHL